LYCNALQSAPALVWGPLCVLEPHSQWPPFIFGWGPLVPSSAVLLTQVIDSPRLRLLDLAAVHRQRLCKARNRGWTFGVTRGGSPGDQNP
jgi:hypothetical protein